MLRAKETTGHRDYEVIRELKAAITAGDLSRVESALEFGCKHLGSSTSEGKGAALKVYYKSKRENFICKIFVVTNNLWHPAGAPQL